MCAGLGLGSPWVLTLSSHILRVHQWQQKLQSGEDIRPGVSQGDGAVFRQILLTQEGVKTQHPWILHTLSKNPDMAGALHIIRAADQPGRPLHQPLQVNVVAERQRGLRGCTTEAMRTGAL